MRWLITLLCLLYLSIDIAGVGQSPAAQVVACFVLHDDLSRLYPNMSQVNQTKPNQTKPGLPKQLQPNPVSVVIRWRLNLIRNSFSPKNSPQVAVLIIMGSILTTLTTVSLHYDRSPVALPLEVKILLLFLHCHCLFFVVATSAWSSFCSQPTLDIYLSISTQL